MATRTRRVRSTVSAKVGRRRAVNVTVDHALLEEARALKISLSQTLEESLRRLVQERRSAAWLEENREALDAYNEHVARDGVFSDGLRSF